jgi:hypothetical protein
MSVHVPHCKVTSNSHVSDNLNHDEIQSQGNSYTFFVMENNK